MNSELKKEIAEFVFDKRDIMYDDIMTLVDEEKIDGVSTMSVDEYFKCRNSLHGEILKYLDMYNMPNTKECACCKKESNDYIHSKVYKRVLCMGCYKAKIR